jgi:hypothetical protein
VDLYAPDFCTADGLLTEAALTAVIALTVGPGWMSAKPSWPALWRPSRGAATNLSPAQTFVRSGAYHEAAVFSRMAGSSPAMTEKQNPNRTQPSSVTRSRPSRAFPERRLGRSKA